MSHRFRAYYSLSGHDGIVAKGDFPVTVDDRMDALAAAVEYLAPMRAQMPGHRMDLDVVPVVAEPAVYDQMSLGSMAGLMMISPEVTLSCGLLLILAGYCAVLVWAYFREAGGLSERKAKRMARRWYALNQYARLMQEAARAAKRPLDSVLYDSKASVAFCEGHALWCSLDANGWRVVEHLNGFTLLPKITHNRRASLDA